MIASDEQVLFFPSLGFPAEDGSGKIQVSLRGWIFEPEFESLRRRALMGALCRSLHLLKEECETDLFRERAKYFLVDNERGRTISVQVGGERYLSEPSGKEGHFLASFELSPAAVRALQGTSSSPWLSVGARRAHDELLFQGEFLPLTEGGLAVVSDVDDTVKITGVTKIPELLRNTFTRPFQAAPELLSLFQEWERQGASFHYVTAAPWQLYPTLVESLSKARFPKGSFHMKEFRWKDSRLLDLFLAQEKYKTPILESFLHRLPRTRFIFVGDTGEKDPEIFGGLLKKYSDREISVVLRELPEAPLSPERRRSAFDEHGLARLQVVPAKTSVQN